MGFLNDLKKLVFGAQSVGKSAVDKGIHMAKETGEDMKEKAEDLGKAALEKTSGLRDAILHQAEGTIDMVNKSETLKKVATKADQIGESVLSKGEELLDKGGEIAESIGDKIFGEDNENLEKAKEFTEKLGGKVMEAKEKMVDKAQDALEDINKKIDETLAKAKEEDIVEASKPVTDLKDVLKANEKSSLDAEDDFFTKAQKYADGDYSGVLEGKVTVEKTKITTKKPPATAAGFTDHDGDGNEVVDDAIILEGEEE